MVVLAYTFHLIKQLLETIKFAKSTKKDLEKKDWLKSFQKSMNLMNIRYFLLEIYLRTKLCEGLNITK